MYLLRKKYHIYVVFFCLIPISKLSYALEFQPGVGLGVQYTDNAELAPDEKISDTIAIGYVGASLVEDEGSLVYDTEATLRRESYINNTFEDRRYLNLKANANWAMLRDRFNWFLTDEFSQAPVRSLDSNTPENRQDRNIFIFGADIIYPISGRQSFSLVPQYSQYYYEVSKTDNKQYSLVANWNYQMFRTTNLGFSFASRKLLYVDRSLSDTTFTTFGLIASGQRVRSSYTINLGATSVKRDAAEGSTGTSNSTKSSGFTGSVNLQGELSSRSTMEALVLTEITDTSSISKSTAPGNPDDVQLSTDAIRNSIIRLAYVRNDAALHSRIWGEYRKVRYSDNTSLNSLLQTFGAELDFPVTQLVSSGVFVNFFNTKRQETLREDKRFNVGTNVDVNFSSSLSGSFVVQYRTKESTDSSQNYDEFSIYASLTYGFGDISQRSIAY